ncbi:MAG: tetratricopeptide repeat protein [Spirochaetales bacterium]|jgi:tetratricopeptide (TPR) repeat protein|nr:tetratricopeptide repeat protein [Spirochaetales bacterium]
MKKGGLFIIIISFFFAAGCASGSSSPGRSTQAQGGGNHLEEARDAIAIGSPEQLNHAISLLSAGGASEAGEELKGLASFFLRTLYPLTPGAELQIPISQGSFWAPILRAVEAGQWPQVAPANVSFLTSLVSPVAILFTQSETIYAQAEETLRQLIQLNPASVLPAYLSGRLGEKRGQDEAAMTNYRRALELDPSCYPAELGLSRILIRQGQGEEALPRLNRLAGLYPRSPEILGALAEAYFSQGSYEQALTTVTDALIPVPDNESLLFLRARILERMGRLDQASRILSIVERSLPNDPEVILLRVRLNRDGGNNAQALAQIRRAYEMYPQREDIESLYGELLIAAGDVQAGRDLLNQTGRASGDGEHLASLDILLKDAVASLLWAEAQGYSNRILEHRRGLADLLTAREIAQALNDTAGVQALETELFQQFSGDPQVQMIRIRSLIQRGQLIQARELIQQALQTSGSFSRRSTLYYLLSLTLAGETEKIEALRSALLEDLENRDALVELSRIYAARRDYRNALRYLRQATQLAPSDQALQQELRDLERRAQ